MREKMRNILIVILLSLAAAFVLAGDPALSFGQSASEKYKNMERMGWFSWAGLGEIGTIDAADFMVLESLHKGRIEYEISPMTMVPLVFPTVVNESGERERVVYYNFRGVVNGLTWGLSSVFAGVGLSDVDGVLDSRWHYVWFAPNCRLRVRLSENLKFVLGSRTDYMLYRTASSDRGIVFTPHIGLSHTTGKFGEYDYSGFSVSVGYRKMWNFDDESGSGEFALLVNLWGVAGI